MPNADFVGLVQSIVATGEAALGTRNALTARLERDGVTRSRATAERSLRLLEALAAKTRGNLDAEEAAILSGGLASLRAGLEGAGADA